MKRLLATLSILGAFTFSQAAFAQQVSDESASQTVFNAALDDQSMAALPVVSDQTSIAQAAATVAGKGGRCGGLNLSDEQLEKIHSLRNKQADASGAKKLELQSLSRQLKDVISGESLDRSKAMELQGKINSLRSELANARLNLKLETLAILTPEQKQELRHKQLQRQALGGKGGHRGRKGHGHQGRRNHKVEADTTQAQGSDEA